ncbi:MAG: hypothetical protein WC314_09345 [Vulcanimicrobiota bacterium]
MSLAESHKRLARTLVERGLGVPAVFLLENLKPFSVVAQQTLYATHPLAVFGGFQGLHKDAVGLFESRETMEAMLLEVERLLDE